MDQSPTQLAATAGPREGDDGRGRARLTLSTRGRLALLVGAVLLPIVIFAAILLGRFSEAERGRLQDEALGAARQASFAVDRELVGLTAALDALATSPALQTGDLAAFDAQARAVLRARGSFVALRDRGGQQLMNSSRPFGAALPVSTDPVLLATDRQVFETGRTVISDLYIGATTRLPLILVDAPVVRDGTVVYALNIALDPARLAETLAAYAPSDWTVALIDRRDRIVARSRQHERFIGSEATESLRASTATGDARIWTGLTLEGTEVLSAFVRSPVTGWRVAVGVPLAAVRAPLDDLTRLLLGAAALVLTISLIAAALVARGIERPFGRLRDAAVRLGLGQDAGQGLGQDVAQDAAITRSGLREADEIGEALRGAALSVREREAALRESEARFRNLADHAPVMIWTTDPTGACTYLSRSWYAFTGQSPEGALGQGWLEAVHLDDRGWSGELFAAANERREAFRLEYRLRRADGTYAWAIDAAAPRFAPDGTFLGYVGSVVDIDARKRAEERLAEGEARLRLALEGAALGAWRWDAGTDLVDASERAAALVGLPPGPSATWSRYAALIHPDDAERVRDALARTVGPEDAPYDVEYRSARADDGPVVWIAAKGRAQRDAAGAVTGVIGTVQDVGVRKREEARRLALAALSDRIRDLDDPDALAYAAAEILGTTLGTSRAGYGTIDTAAETITIERDWNAPGVRSLAGVLRFRDYGSYIEDLKQGRTVVFADAETDPRTAANADALKAISAQSVVNMPVTERGGFVALLYLNNATARAWSAEDLALIRDVAERTRTAVERRRAEAELAASEEFNRRVLQASADCIKVLSLDTRLEFMSEGGMCVMEVDDFGAMKGACWPDFWPGGGREKALAAVATAKDGGTGRFQDFAPTAKGSPRWWDVIVTAIDGPDGRPEKLLSVSRDVTEQRRAEERLREGEERLRELNATLERRVADAVAERDRTEAQLRQSQKMDAVGQLTGGVAHDFNNLLTVVSGNLEMLKRRIDGGGDPRLLRHVDGAIEGARRAATLTHRLLAFSRQSPLQPEVVDANKLVAGMSDLLRRTLGEQVAVETVLAGGLWRMEADPNGLENALLNLAVNARDAMPDGGKLTIETANCHLDDAYAASTGGETKAGQYVMVSVSDTGHGMTAAVKARVFEPFFTTKPVGKGTGLGLAQVYGFAKQSGGHAAIYSEPDHGTTLKLYFPRVVRADDRVQAVPQADAEMPRGRGELILVVEDEPMVRDFSTSALEEAGYRVLAAEDGPTALRLLEQHRDEVALMFTDVVLTGPMNGRKVADRAAEIRPDLRVLFTTGYTRNAIIHHGRLDEGVELIGKPFTAQGLAERVRRLIEQP